jgi:hypothetical protein
MAYDDECERYARECVRLARLVNEPALREQLLQMAPERMAEAMGEDDAPVLPPGKQRACPIEY